MLTNVMIGEVKLAGPTDQLQALLGSCVGVALLWPKRGRCTLSHSLIPTCPDDRTEISGRWVDLAIASALGLLEVTDRDRRQLQAFIAGGSDMFGEGSNRKVRVGELNVAQARKSLREWRISTAQEHVGGMIGRQLRVCGKTLNVEVVEIPRQ